MLGGPQHRVYVIEVKVIDPKISWTLYVGYTNLYLRERWQRYIEMLDKIFKYFRTHRVEATHFRYDLMDRWGPYETREEAIMAEGDLPLALQKLGHAVYSDQLKAAIERQENE